MTRPSCSRRPGAKELSYIGLYTGRERIRKSLFTRYGNAGRRGASMAIHQKTRPLVSVSADGQSAQIRSRLFQINSQSQGEGSYIAGIYENLMVKEHGVWKDPEHGSRLHLDHRFHGGMGAREAGAMRRRSLRVSRFLSPGWAAARRELRAVPKGGLGRVSLPQSGVGSRAAGAARRRRIHRRHESRSSREAGRRRRKSIRRLLREYGRRLDAGDLRGYADLFAVDGEWVGGFGAVKGRANIEPFMAKNMRNPLPIEGAPAAVARPGPRGAHLMTNEIIDVKGDQATAWSKWTLSQPQRREPPRARHRRPLRRHTRARERRMEIPEATGVG